MAAKLLPDILAAAGAKTEDLDGFADLPAEWQTKVLSKFANTSAGGAAKNAGGSSSSSSSSSSAVKAAPIKKNEKQPKKPKGKAKSSAATKVSKTVMKK